MIAGGIILIFLSLLFVIHVELREHRDEGSRPSAFTMSTTTNENQQTKDNPNNSAIQPPNCGGISDGETWEPLFDNVSGYVVCHPTSLHANQELFSAVQDSVQAGTPSTNSGALQIEMFPFPRDGFTGTVQGANVFISRGAGVCHDLGSASDQIVNVGGVPFMVQDTTWAGAAEEGTGAVWSTAAGGYCFSIGWFEWDFNPYVDPSNIAPTERDELVEKNQLYVQRLGAVFSKMLGTFTVVK